MTGDLLKAHVLSSKLMTDIEDIMIEEFGLPEGHIDIGLFTTDNEDILATWQPMKRPKRPMCGSAMPNRLTGDLAVPTAEK